MTAEPTWVRGALWWRLYPLGFVGAYPESAAGAAAPHEHRLRRITPWLDHAVDLGASGISLGPIFASATHGYDTLDYYHIDPRLGDDNDFDALITEAHGRGLRVQLDGVFNHVSRHHPRVIAALEDGPDSDSARWFCTLPSETGMRLKTFEDHEALVVLNHTEPAVEDAIVQVMQHWLDRGADAWRLDAAYAVSTAFWARVLPRVRHTHPQTWFEAEVIHGDYTAFVRDSTADTVTQYELWKAIWSSINDRNFYELDWALRRHSEMLRAFAPATFIGNHDVTRIASQVADPGHLPHAIVLLTTLGGTPGIYAGDEYAMQGIKEQRVGGDDAIRPEFPVDGPGSLPISDTAVYGLYQRLVGLRRRHAWLHLATSESIRLANDQYVIQLADGAGNTLLVALNLADRPLEVPDANQVVDADPITSQAPDVIAPHGWGILAT